MIGSGSTAPHREKSKNMEEIGIGEEKSNGKTGGIERGNCGKKADKERETW